MLGVGKGEMCIFHLSLQEFFLEKWQFILKKVEEIFLSKILVDWIM